MKPKRLESTAAEELERVEEQLQHTIDAPGHEMRAIESQLETLGVGRTELNDEWVRARLSDSLNESERLAKRLELTAQAPQAKTLPIPSRKDRRAWVRSSGRGRFIAWSPGEGSIKSPTPPSHPSTV